MADDLSQESFDNLIQSVDRLTQGMTSAAIKSARAQKDKENTDKEERSTRQKIIKSLGEFDRNFERTTDTIKDFGRGADAALRAMRGIAGLGIFVTLSREALGLAESWQKMTEIGNTYGGSMLTMLQSAASAGMSMEEYAKIQGQFNVMINTTGHNFFDMQKKLRENISAQGSYGMTVDQLNQLMGTTMEASRKAGALEHRSSSQLVKDMGDLALTTTAVAGASDKAREEILRLANQASSSALALAQLRLTDAAMRGQVDKNLKEVLVGFAALPGKAGEFFSAYAAESFGGMAALTTQGGAMIEAGLSGMVVEMDSLAMKLKSGTATIDDQINYQNRFIDEVESNLPVLKAQAMAGNTNAAEMIEMAAEMKKTTRAELEARKAKAANADALTAFFASLDSMLGLLIHDGFVSSFLKAFGDVGMKMDEFAKSESFIAIKDMLSELGTWLGSFLSTTLSNMKPEEMKEFISGAIVGIKDFVTAIIPVAKFVTDALASLASVVGWTIAGFNALGEMFGTSGGKIAVTLGIIALVGSKIGGLISGIRNLMGIGTMNIKAAVVNIDEAGGGGGGGRRRGRRGRRGARPRGRAGRGLGGLGGLGRGLSMGRVAAGGLGAAAGLGLGYVADNYMEQGSLGQQAVSVGSSALTGASTGALVGSFLGPGGTLAGGLVGGGLGALYGLYDQYSKASAAGPATGAAASAASLAAMEGFAPTAKPVDPMMTLNDTLKKNSEEMVGQLQSLGRKMDRTISLLTKLEVNTQSL